MVATILERAQKSKLFMSALFAHRDLFPAVLLIVVGVASFGLGRLSVAPSQSAVQNRLAASSAGGGGSRRLPDDGSLSGQTESGQGKSGTQETRNGEEGTSIQQQAMSAAGRYVGSRNGTKYHLPWCSGAARIKEENKVWFSSKEEAEAAGYTPAANCKGI
jgi:hypothetical protein